MQLLFERLNGPLSDYHSVIHHECLMILEEALYGLKELRDSLRGLPTLTDRSIFINADSEVRVWGNPDLTSFEYTASPSEAMAIDSVYQAIGQHCEGRQFLPEFVAFWQGARPSKIEQAIQLSRRYQDWIYESGGVVAGISEGMIKKPKARFW